MRVHGQEGVSQAHGAQQDCLFVEGDQYWRPIPGSWTTRFFGDGSPPGAFGPYG